MKTGKFLSRRDFLRLSALGIGAATLSACGQKATPTVEPTKPVEVEPTKEQAVEPTTPPEPTAEPTAAPVVEIVVTTSGWPINVITPEDIAADPSLQAQANSNQAFMDANPGVRLEKKDVPIWDPQAIQAMIAGGTDCSYLFGPCAGGGWGLDNAKNAFVQGLLADITAEVAKYKLQEKCLPHLWAGWAPNSSLNGKFWCYPLNEYSPDLSTFMYRKDLILAAGRPEPKIGWTFEEFAETIKAITKDGVTGLGMPSWFLPGSLSLHGFDILSLIPAPEQAWHWDRDLTSDPRWVEIITQYRKLLFEDKAILTDVALGGGDDEYVKLFQAGSLGMCRSNYWSMFGSPTETTSLAAFADREGKEYKDMFGAVVWPSGDGYQKGGGVNLWGPVSFSPNDKPEVKDKAVGWVDFKFFGEGLIIHRTGIWELTKDPRSVYNAFLFLDGRTSYEGVPATAADAWGQDVVDAWVNIGKIPYEPARDNFFKPEENPQPSNQAIDDAFSLMVTDIKLSDFAGALKKAETDWKAQLPGFASSLTTEDFKAGAKDYYTALDTHLKTNYPDFYENRFKPFYEAKVLPAIG